MTIRSRMVVWTLALTFLFTCRPMQAQTEPLVNLHRGRNHR